MWAWYFLGGVAVGCALTGVLWFIDARRLEAERDYEKDTAREWEHRHALLVEEGWQLPPHMLDWSDDARPTLPLGRGRG